MVGRDHDPNVPPCEGATQAREGVVDASEAVDRLGRAAAMLVAQHVEHRVIGVDQAAAVRQRVGHVDDGGGEVLEVVVGFDVGSACVAHGKTRKRDLHRGHQRHGPAGVVVHRRHREQPWHEAERLEHFAAAPDQRQGGNHATEAAVVDEPAVESMLGGCDARGQRGDGARRRARAHRAQAAPTRRMQRGTRPDAGQKAIAEAVDDDQHHQRLLAGLDRRSRPAGVAVVQPGAQSAGEAVKAASAVIGQDGSHGQRQLGIGHRWRR